MRGEFIFRYLGRVILPEVLQHTLILTIVLYRLLYRISRRSMTDGGGADSFV